MKMSFHDVFRASRRMWSGQARHARCHHVSPILSVTLLSFFLVAGRASLIPDTSTGLPILLRNHPYYHTTQQIRDELSTLETSGKCPGLSVYRETWKDSTSGSEGQIDIVSIKRVSQPVNRLFVLAGEHARELISAESALHFIWTLCGYNAKNADAAKIVLRTTAFRVIVNGNPLSRREVESGKFCLRFDEHNVDLNRNWANHWESSLNSGPKPFSESQSQIFQRQLRDFQPTSFLTIHSGNLGVFMPYAYTTNEVSDLVAGESMRKIVTSLDEKFCNCRHGSMAGRGTVASGTCLDWVYDNLNQPLSFAVEIFDDGMYRGENGAGKKRENQFSVISGAPLLKFFEINGINFDARCFQKFNPANKKLYDETLKNWSAAYLELARQTAETLYSQKSLDVSVLA